MPKSNGPSFYAVKIGKKPGIYLTWDEAEHQVHKFTGAKYKKFHSRREAENFMSGAMEETVPLPTPGPLPTSESTSKGKKRDSSTLKEALDTEVVYCDGACKGNGKVMSVAGVGVWWGRDDSRNIAERCPGDQTNNRAELIVLQAIARVLESTPISNRPLLIKTDSTYSIKSFKEWLPNWQQNGFRTSNGDPVKNVAVIRYIAALLHQRERQGQHVDLEYVKAHCGIEGNEGADYQANLGAVLPARPDRDWDALREAVEEGDRKPKSETESHPQKRPRLAETQAPITEPPQKISRAELEAYAACLEDEFADI